MAKELEALRNKIDTVDKQLLDLLEQRLKLVEEVGHVKTEHGLPIYCPEREKAMLSARRAEASKRSINPDLIEDVLRRTMRESYQLEQDKGFKRIHPEPQNIVIIGGQGEMGKMFLRMFALSGYQVDSIDKDDWDKAPDLLTQANLVIVSVPIDKTLAIIETLDNLPKDCILADITSIKAEPLKAMLATHSGPVLGLHPMFGPDISSFAKEVIIHCEGRHPEQYQWVLDQMAVWGGKIQAVPPQQHDDLMGFIQALRHFTTFVYGRHLCAEGVDIDTLMTLSSPIYRLELMMVGRLFAQSPELYADIIMSSHHHQKLIDRFQECLQRGTELIDTQNREAFIEQFKEVNAFLGSFADECLDESQRILQENKDRKKG